MQRNKCIISALTFLIAILPAVYFQFLLRIRRYSWINSNQAPVDFSTVKHLAAMIVELKMIMKGIFAERKLAGITKIL